MGRLPPRKQPRRGLAASPTFCSHELMPLMYELTVDTRFSAAHRLRGYDGLCERLHGHNYRLQIVLSSEEITGLGMVMDFRDAKAIADETVERLDHRYLNEVEPFDKLNPTAELIGRYIGQEMASRLPQGVRLCKVTCWESDRCAARYIPDRRSAPVAPEKDIVR